MYWNIYEEHEWNEADRPCPKIALQWTVSIGIPCDSAKALIISNPTYIEQDKSWF